MSQEGKQGFVWKALLSVFGIVLGAFMSFRYGQETTRQQMLEAQKASAYVQFVEAGALYTRLIETENELEAAKQRGLKNAARFRIAIYGSKDVLEGIVRDIKAKDGSPEDKEAIVEWFQAMRNEIVPEDEQVDDEVMHVLIWLHE